VHAAPMRGEARFPEETLLIEWPKDGKRLFSPTLLRAG